MVGWKRGKGKGGRDRVAGKGKDQGYAEGGKSRDRLKGGEGVGIC